MLLTLGFLRFFFDEKNLTPYAQVAVFVGINLDSRGYVILHRDRFGLTVFRDFHKTPSVVG